MDAQVEHRAPAPGRVQEPVGPARQLREASRHGSYRLPDFAALHEVDERNIVAPKAEDMGDEKHSAAFLLRGDHAVATNCGERKGLLQEHMFPALSAAIVYSAWRCVGSVMLMASIEGPR